jgi:NIPSNAP
MRRYAIVEVAAEGPREEVSVITCCIQYTIDPQKLAAFEDYAARWPPIIERCGGQLVGYYLPKEANNFALALIDFPSLADYEVYRQRLADDAEAKQNFADGKASGCILVESRSFLRRA